MVEMELPYSYVVAGEKSSDWRHYGKLAHPLPGASYARVWLINFNSAGKVYFDNVLFVKVTVPDG